MLHIPLLVTTEKPCYTVRDYDTMYQEGVMSESTARKICHFRLSEEERRSIKALADAIGTNRTAALRYAVRIALAAQQIKAPNAPKRLDASLV